MRANTIVMIPLAIVFGVVAVFLANMWLSGQRSLLARGGDKTAGIPWSAARRFASAKR